MIIIKEPTVKGLIEALKKAEKIAGKPLNIIGGYVDAYYSMSQLTILDDQNCDWPIDKLC